MENSQRAQAFLVTCGFVATALFDSLPGLLAPYRAWLLGNSLAQAAVAQHAQPSSTARLEVRARH